MPRWSSRFGCAAGWCNVGLPLDLHICVNFKKWFGVFAWFSCQASRFGPCFPRACFSSSTARFNLWTGRRSYTHVLCLQYLLWSLNFRYFHSSLWRRRLILQQLQLQLRLKIIRHSSFSLHYLRRLPQYIHTLSFDHLHNLKFMIQHQTFDWSIFGHFLNIFELLYSFDRLEYILILISTLIIYKFIGLVNGELILGYGLL